ncbi:MAG TPA: cytochrome c oxidase subunit II [Thermoleophilaceae bacterium]
MPRRPTRRVLLAALSGAVLLLLIAAPAVFADAITPESSGSPNAQDIDTLFKITLYIAIVIFLIVEGTLIWSLVRYRARRGGPPAAQIRGNTPLEFGWTLAAAMILVVLVVVTFIYLPDIENPPPSGPGGLASNAQYASVDQPAPPTSGGRTLTIKVTGQQYIWRFDYPGSKQLFSYHTMVVPSGTTVVLQITASDVIHSWWIPRLGGKVDGVPGYINETWFKIPRGQEGIYRGQCAELCGAGHADMRGVVDVRTPDDYVAWADRQRTDIQAAKDGLAEMNKERESGSR